MSFDIHAVRARLADLKRPERARVHADLGRFSRPRLTGTEQAAEVEADLCAHFEALGYRTTPLPFSFSGWPGRFGLSVAGAVLCVGAVLGTWLILADLAAAALLGLAGALGLAVLPWLTLERTLQRLPWGRVATTNLLFRKPGPPPSWILMAHRDSKSQLVPTLGRTTAVVAALIAWAGLVVLAALWFAGETFRFTGVTVLAGVILLLSGLALALSWAGNRSPGALDNASGLAALLAVARGLGDASDVAFLLTDGEELGLAGARAVASELPPVQGVINVDGLDDHGAFYLVEGYGIRRSGSAPQLAAALLTAGAALDLPVRRRTLPRTLLVDHVPIAAWGIPSLTLLRGDWRSLLRVHRPADDPSRIDGSGAADGATLLTAAVHLLRDQQASHLADARAARS